MSTITLVGSLANTVIAPLAPAGTIAALALILPSEELRVETAGCGCPDGHTERNPSGPKGTTVRFSEYAAAFAGIPQGLDGIAKSRLLLAGIDGPPKGSSAASTVLANNTKKNNPLTISANSNTTSTARWRNNCPCRN